MAVNVKVSIRRGESPERLIRRFIKKCKRDNIMEIYRAKTDHYIKDLLVGLAPAQAPATYPRKATKKKR